MEELPLVRIVLSDCLTDFHNEKVLSILSRKITILDALLLKHI